MTHDPLCPFPMWDQPCPTCEDYASVRADEREKAALRDPHEEQADGGLRPDAGGLHGEVPDTPESRAFFRQLLAGNPHSMCGCGQTRFCPGGCECGCEHDLPEGVLKQAQHLSAQCQSLLEGMARSLDAARAEERAQAAQRVANVPLHGSILDGLCRRDDAEWAVWGESA